MHGLVHRTGVTFRECIWEYGCDSSKKRTSLTHGYANVRRPEWPAC